jgi:hypothetical protein
MPPLTPQHQEEGYHHHGGQDQEEVGAVHVHHSMGRLGTAEMSLGPVLHYEELSRVQAKTMYLQEEELIITNI